MAPDGELVAARLARGCRCFGAFLDDGSLGGFGWLSTGPEWIGELQLEIAPGRSEAYVWNCVTVPEHRRRGIFGSLLVGISALAHSEGLRRLWIGSVAIPAERAVGPSGFRPALRFTTWTVAGIHARLTAGADPNLAEAARGVLNNSSRLHVGRSRPRRH